MPAIIATIISVIEAIIKNAPNILNAVAILKQFISNLFGAGVISKADQDALHAHVDALALAMIKGEEPPQWTVEPDPT